MRKRFGVICEKAAAIVIILIVGAVFVLAQGSPRVTGVEPAAAKVGASITVHGENLGKGNVTAADFLMPAASGVGPICKSFDIRTIWEN